MSDKSSPRFTVIETEASRQMSKPVATNMQEIAYWFCGPQRAGESQKGRIRRGWEAAGRPPFWRFRSAFYGEAGPWSAAAYTQFQDLYRAALAREARKAANAKAIEDLKHSVRKTDLVENARDEYRTLVARIEAIEAALRIRS